MPIRVQPTLPTGLLVSALLAGAGGYLDAFTYLDHGHVFANAMTGNVVLLGINLFSGAWPVALRHLPPIFAFVFGTAVAMGISLHFRSRYPRAHHPLILSFEIAIFLVIAFLPETVNNFVVTISVAFAASLQAQTFREVHGKSYNSTFTTGNLRTLSEAGFTWLFEGRAESALSILKDFGTICGAFLAGAIAGGLISRALGNRALLVEIGMLLCAIVLIGYRSSGDMIVHQEP